MRALMYHAVTPVSGGLRYLGLPLGLLSDHLRAMTEYGYLLVGLTEAMELASDPAQKAVALTFDDAYTDFLQVAVPALAKVGARATVYVPTGHIGSEARWLGSRSSSVPRVMSLEQLGECVASGCVEIGSHGHSHRPLDTLPAAVVEAEVSGSRWILEDRLQVPVRSFCYPHGYHSREVRAVVARSGYDNACEVGRRLRSARHRLCVSRIAVEPRRGGERLLREIARGGPLLTPSAKRTLQPAWRQVRRYRQRASRRLP
jgi:peptidoglycan/xylan/chitin deacetylase (PgdA/CDA1 family)